MARTPAKPSPSLAPATKGRRQRTRRRLTTNAGAFGDRMYQARDTVDLALDRAAVRIGDTLGSTWGPSRETLRRYEDGTTTEDRADPLIVAAAAIVYDVDLKWLSARVAEQMKDVGWLAERLKSHHGRLTPKPRNPQVRGTRVRWSSDSSRPSMPRRNTHPRAVA